MTSVTAWNSIDGLPKQFITSLKVLFDILDEGNRGYVKFSDIEARWHEEGVRGLPSGVTEALRKVTPSNGYLTFDRFVAGLKLALLTSQKKPRDPKDDKENSQPVKELQSKPISKPVAAPRDAVLTKSSSSHPLNRLPSSATNTAAVRPNNAMSSKERNGNDPTPHNHHKRTEYDKSRDSKSNQLPSKRPVPPPRPQRPSYSSVKNEGQLPPKVPPRDKSKNIITELKNWQRRMNHQSSDHPQATKKFQSTQSDSNLLERNVDKGRQNIYENIDQVQLLRQEAVPSTSTPTSPPQQRQATVKRRDSARRHTLANGVDYNMIKRMKQLEQEKDSLLKGLDMVEQAREWYHRQVVGVEEKQKYIGHTSYHDYNLEANQERMNFQYARIMEVNQQLKTLIESSERGFPLHMNLAVGHSTAQRGETESFKTLQENQKHLKKELRDKTDKIVQLEKEKASLIRDLFEAHAKGKNYDDTTFM
ncbi:suppressor APC domain-containing protein 2-like isoform X2 [Ostrea edulis]|uniref:suppressor APC domain-containing protein 2-like isoform X2 n=1 Tax=Ostrea edulis TaxID=37623 RepID=UPI0020953DFA|nr:suppressor APC domain-containing protein 2-like isoform X2 [Ostrea edulis]